MTGLKECTVLRNVNKMNEYLIAIIVIVVVFGIALTIAYKGKSKREQYTEGFRWGRVEHKSESAATWLLTIGLAMLWIHLWLNNLFIGYVAFGVFCLALITRIIASIAHHREKAIMDKLRFKRKD